jgi:hypothetical protein
VSPNVRKGGYQAARRLAKSAIESLAIAAEGLDKADIPSYRAAEWDSNEELLEMGRSAVKRAKQLERAIQELCAATSDIDEPRPEGLEAPPQTQEQKEAECGDCQEGLAAGGGPCSECNAALCTWCVKHAERKRHEECEPIRCTRCRNEGVVGGVGGRFAEDSDSE